MVVVGVADGPTTKTGRGVAEAAGGEVGDRLGVVRADDRPSSVGSHTADAGIASSLDAATIHGAKGYVSEFEVERQLRDAVGGLVYSGSTDVLRNIVARHIGIA